MDYFRKAKPIWIRKEENTYNQFAGFRNDICLDHECVIHIAIAARNYYRLYINGEFVANGPARTLKNHCRIDEIEIPAQRMIRIAVEVLAMDRPDGYSNDITLEEGLLAVEVSCESRILSATGDGTWYGELLNYRRMNVELMSHSRGILEVCDLDPESYNWRTGMIHGNKDQTIILTEEPVFLKRRAPYPTYRQIKMNSLVRVCDIVPSEKVQVGFISKLAKQINPIWYSLLDQSELFLDQLYSEKERCFTGSYLRVTGTAETEFELHLGEHPAAVVFSLEQSELGFIQLTVTVEKEAVLDIVNTDHLTSSGEARANTYVTRYNLKSGTYQLRTFDPKLTRYIKLIFRTSGSVRFTEPVLLDDSYPDTCQNTFSCSDGELNMIYAGARRTLRLCTHDIFMDCPQRERGGWLCDSFFSAYAAWQMFGDLTVERDFLENFMLTDPAIYKNAFFPEVCPGSKSDTSDPGIENWSFWLMLELCDYYERSGDREFIDGMRERVEQFVEGLETYRNSSGLYEWFHNIFVDWSLSNRYFCTEYISVPVNCLITYMLERLSNLYNNSEWAARAVEMRNIIEKIPPGWLGYSDSVTYEDKEFVAGDCLTESGIGLQIFSGFKRKDRSFIRKYVENMGTCPIRRPDPNVGRANLFIGLMIRFINLARLGEIQTMVRELKDVYLPELIHGSGTLYENYAAYSGCHGFNGMAGALIANEVLGLGHPLQQSKTIRISPHPGSLDWASGTATCKDGNIQMNWSADHVEHILQITLLLPEGWQPVMDLPFELEGWKVWVNGECFFTSSDKFGKV